MWFRFEGRPDLVRDEQAESFVADQPLSLAITTLLALSVVALIGKDHADASLVVWFAIVCAINLARTIFSSLSATGPSLRFGASLILRVSLFGSMMAGLVWACVPLFYVDYATAEAPFVLIVLCGLTAGAALQSRSYAAPAVVLCFPILMSIVVKLVLLGSESGIILGGDVLLFLVMLIRSSYASETAFAASAAVKHQASALAARLQVEHAASTAAADRFFYLANHDALTGVANRTAFTQTLDVWLEAARTDDVCFSFFLLDLDHFKAINDTLGHGAGDEVLREVVRRLASSGDDARFVARLGGDEFAVLLGRGVSTAEQARLADQLVTAISGAFVASGSEVNVGVSIGIATFPQDGPTAQDLMVRADLSLYAAKEAGRQGWRRFDTSLLAVAEMARDVESGIPSALADGCMQVWWQPQVAMRGARLVGLEALIRWHHPRHGWIAPPLIVASALKIRKSEAITAFVLEQACGMIKALDRAGRRDVCVAVNISPREIQHYDLVALVRRMIGRHDVDARRLELEITEEAAIDDAAIAVLADMSRLGVRLAIDDFGTGFSSIASLRNLRVDRIKIDRSFVTGIADRDGDRILVQAILGIGQSLGIEVVAEGVETVPDALLMQSLGCRVAQGFLYGQAMPAHQIRQRIGPDRLEGAASIAAEEDDPGLTTGQMAGAGH